MMTEQEQQQLLATHKWWLLRVSVLEKELQGTDPLTWNYVTKTKAYEYACTQAKRAGQLAQTMEYLDLVTG